MLSCRQNLFSGTPDLLSGMPDWCSGTPDWRPGMLRDLSGIPRRENIIAISG
jgi:hypothetical protein